jgi:hypothetical protein
MAFVQISRQTLERLNQAYRSPGVLPLSVDLTSVGETASSEGFYKVADEFIRVVPFAAVEPRDRPFAKQYVVTSATPLAEPAFSSALKQSTTDWVPGATTAFGQELTAALSRFKKVSVHVRADELGVSQGAGDDVLEPQIQLASVAVVRALSLAIFQSNPASPQLDDAAEFSGMPFYLTLPGFQDQDISFDKQRLMVGGLTDIAARCCPSHGDFGVEPDVFVMSSRARWRLLIELENRGIQPDYQYCQYTGRLQLHFHGIPVLTGRVREAKSPQPAGSTEAWALKLFGPTGIRVVHVGGESRTFGVRIEPTTTVTQAAPGTPPVEVTSATRGAEVFAVYSLLVPEPQSLARLKEIPSDPFVGP